MSEETSVYDTIAGIRPSSPSRKIIKVDKIQLTAA